jgi:hypothetical protein
LGSAFQQCNAHFEQALSEQAADFVTLPPLKAGLNDQASLDLEL